MKSIAFILFFAFESFAQSSQPWSVISSGSSLPANVPRVGYCFFRTADSSLHISTGKTWRNIGPGEFSLLDKFIELPAGFWIGDAGDFTGATFSQDQDATNDFTEDYLAFPDGSDTYASATFVMPEDWDRVTHPDFYITVSSPTGSANNVNFELSARYIRIGTDSWKGAQGTAASVNVSPTTADVDYLTSIISPTPAGSINTSASVQMMVQVRWFRDGDDGTNDTHTAEARVKTITMQYRTSIDFIVPDVYEVIEIPAGYFNPKAGDLAGATALADDADNTNDFTLDQLEFSDTAENYASATVSMPPDWDGTTAPKFKVIYYSETGHASQTVDWGIATGYVRPGTDSWIAAIGTEAETANNPTTADVWYITNALSPTPAGTAAVGAQIKIRLRRDGDDGTNDTHAATSRLVKLLMQYKKTSYGSVTSW